jgi:hypothetical protein
MSQIIINTGNIANDGTGDPLRTAFNDTNNNFTQIFNAGPVNSNITIANNTIQVTNTNGNLKLATNGIGVIVPATNIVPDIPNVRYLGTATNRFNTVYAQYLDAPSGSYSGNLYVGGNLFVVGNTITTNYSNIGIANLNITLATDSPNAVLANNAGIIVHSANAKILYNHSANTWNSTISVTAPSFIGDGSELTNVNAIVNAVNLVGNVLSTEVNESNLTSFGSLLDISATGNISTTGNVHANIISGTQVTANYLAGNGSNITNITANFIVGNVPFAQIANSAYTANLAALATQAINADTALFAINANLAAFANVATSSQTSNRANYSVQSDNANSAVVAGTAYELSPNANISVIGNITTSGYFIGNGSQLTGIVAVANYSNANVAAYLPTYSGNINNLTFSPDVVTGPTNGNGYPYLKLTPGDTRVGDDAGDISLWAQGNVYNFGGDGNITLPSNSSYINYANGQPYNGSSSLTNGNAVVTLTSDGVLNLPAGHGYVYDATLIGYGSNTAQVHFELDSDLSGTQPEWQAAVTNPGNGYSIGQTFTYDSEFLGIPNASVTISVGNINGSGGVTDLLFTPAPLYPPSVYRENGFIALEANNSRWTLGLNGNLTLPATLVGVATSISIAAPGVGYTTATNVPTDALTGYGSGMTVDLVADTGNTNSIISVTINQRGIGYAASDSIQVSQPSSTGTGELTVDSVATIVPSINYGNGDPYGGAGPGNFIFDSADLDGTAFDEIALAGTNSGNILINADNLVMVLGGYESGGMVANETDVYIFNNDPTFVDGIPQSGVGHIWQFASDGSLNLPQGGYIGPAGVKGDGTMLTGGKGNIASLTSYYANVDALNYSSCVTVNADGTLNITTYGDGTGQLGQWNFSGANLSTAGNIFATSFELSNAGNGVISTLQQNQNPPFGTEAFGIEMLTTLGSNPNVFSSVSAGPDYVALQSTNAGNANITAQGGYGVTITTSDSAGNNIQTWTFEEGGQTQFPGAITAVGNISGSYILGDGGLLSNIAFGGNTAVSTTGNVSGGNILSAGTISATGNIRAPNFIGNLANGASRISVANNGNVTVGVGPFNTAVLNINTSTGISVLGNIVASGYISLTGNVGSNGNISALGNITSNANVITVAASGGTGAAINGAGIQAGTGIATILYDNSVFGWTTNQGFHPTANTTQNLGRTTRYWNNLYAVNVNGVNQAMSGYVSAVGNVYGGNIIGNGSGLTNVAQQTTGSWTVTAGTNDYSFTVNSGTYNMWVTGNIPNGIIAWNALATITNTNVPVVGTQYAWVYNGGGTPIDFVSIPNQFTGTANAIVRGHVAPSSNTNTFTFSINNTSGNSAVVNWGYTKL